MWNDEQGQIWFRALVSFMVVAIFVVWAYICISTKAYAALDWSQVGLILGGLGITAASSYFKNEKVTP